MHPTCKALMNTRDDGSKVEGVLFRTRKLEIIRQNGLSLGLVEMDIRWHEKQPQSIIEPIDLEYGQKEINQASLNHL